MPEADHQEMEKAIQAIQDIAVMLTGASEYVCEERMLRRYPSDIETSLDSLDTYVSHLKSSFPGKVPEAFKPDSLLARIREIASSMRGNDAATQAKCQSGELGDELFMRLKELKAVVGDIQDTLGGKVLSHYSFADRIGEQVVRFKSVFSGLSLLTSYVGKITAGLIIALIISFVYLYATMESEDALIKNINNVLTSIETHTDTLATHMKEYEQITRNINALKKKKLTRDEKIQLLDLSTKSKKVKDRIEKSTLVIEKKEKELADKKKKLEELRKKGFLQKLLKR
jgi:ABC-type multidrug transport system fused ATPase/permease subunit